MVEWKVKDGYQVGIEDETGGNVFHIIFFFFFSVLFSFLFLNNYETVFPKLKPRVLSILYEEDICTRIFADQSLHCQI